MKMFKFCCVTSSRADYDLLRNVLLLLEKNRRIDLEILTTGSHLKKDFGSTVKQIKNDSIKKITQIDIFKDNKDNLQSTADAVSKGIKKFTKYFNKKKFDFVILLGDRLEIFAAATSAYILGIRIFHFSGGDTSFGSLDEKFRHSISIMSDYHFVKLQDHKKRLEGMGIKKNKIRVIGSLASENYKKYKKFSLQDINRKFSIKLKKPFILFTFHPVSNSKKREVNDIELLLNSLAEQREYNFICTASNIDANGIKFNSIIKKFSHNYKNRFHFVENFGKDYYFSLLSHAAAMVGNSSSGIIESPFFKLPTINIMPRQKGRYYHENVIHINNNRMQIKSAFMKIQDKRFIKKCQSIKNKYQSKDPNSLSKNVLKMILKFIEI